MDNKTESADMANADGKDSFETCGIRDGTLSLRDDDDDDGIIIKLEPDDKTGYTVDLGDVMKSTEKIKNDGAGRANLEEGEVLSEGAVESHADLDKKNGSGRNDNDDAFSRGEETNSGTTQEMSNRIPRKEKSNYIWVSNIHRNVKAADLKKFFGNIGKVCTAKILTNGKCFYGYVTMENSALASKCMRQLNNSLFEGERIMVSKNRPEMRDSKTTTKIETTKKKHQEKSEKKKESNSISNISESLPDESDCTEDYVAKRIEDVISISDSDKISDRDFHPERSSTVPVKKTVKPNARKREDTLEVEKKRNSHIKDDNTRHGPRNDDYEKSISDLKKKVKLLRSDNENLKQKFDEYQGRYNIMRNKCISLERELKSLRFENQEDRRRLIQEKENFEKKKKFELSRIEADKDAVNKELAENKKLKVQLEFKIEEFKVATAKVSKRNRSPVLRNVRSPPPIRNGSSSHFRGERTEKRIRREDISRARTPPSPPKYMSDSGRKRSVDVTISDRPYYNEDLKRPSPVSHQFEYRRKPSIGHSSEAPRIDCPTPFQKEPRRSNPVPVSSYSGNSRYATGYPQPSSNINVPLRSFHNPHYFPQW
ncbi:hypothetical protein JTB14_002674 [Gonioctena quinquepunctata]|nr:hypothetical protein JTB14_002674 [Gonioctena quinquepunctata]